MEIESRNLVPQALSVLGTRIYPISLSDAAITIDAWADARESKAIFVADANMVMIGQRNIEFCELINSADLVVPDGIAVAWTMHRVSNMPVTRVIGRELMWEICRLASIRKRRIGLLGGSPKTLEKLVSVLEVSFPGLAIAYASSPAYGNFTTADVRAASLEIERANVDILFVGLGCPKQERWISDANSYLSCPALGVGAAFDFLSGSKPVAPIMLQRLGLEWLFRALSEPRRLGYRYARVVPHFLLALFKERVWNSNSRR